MTIEIVKQRLDSLISSPSGRVLFLSGGWGCGKTFQWKSALDSAAETNTLPRYAYVSLFGLSSLAEVRKRVAEELVSAIKVNDSDSTVGAILANGSWRLKPMQILKVLPAIPWIGKLDSLASELFFATVRDAVICFDDLERSSPGLALGDVFGLASFLKEERNCRVIVITNQAKLNDGDKKKLSVYFEKVIDESVDFVPTSDEGCEIGLARTPESVKPLLLENIKALGITNIRVITRLGEMGTELGLILKDLRPEVLKEAIKTLVMFGAARFLSADGFPTVEAVMKADEIWAKSWTKPKNGDPDTEETRQLASWADLFDRYRYTSTSRFDAEIGRGVQQGFFDHTALRAQGTELAGSAAADALRAEYSEAHSKFWSSVDGSGQEVLAELYDVTTRAIGVIGLDSLQVVYGVFVDAGDPTAAEKLLDLFVEAHDDQPAIFEQYEDHFAGNQTGSFEERIRMECAKRRPQVSVLESLDAIDFERGWNSNDVRVVATATPAQIEEIVLQSHGSKFRSRIKTLLRMGKRNDATPEEKAVSDATQALLQRLAAQDPVSAIRLRRYLPPDPAS